VNILSNFRGGRSFTVNITLCRQRQVPFKLAVQFLDRLSAVAASV
jgi:hypothetical protein